MRSTENVDMTPSQCRAARALIGLTQPALAEAAGLGLSTVVDHEKDRRAVSAAAVAAMQAALEARGVLFLSPGDVSAGLGVALKR